MSIQDPTDRTPAPVTPEGPEAEPEPFALPVATLRNKRGYCRFCGGGMQSAAWRPSEHSLDCIGRDDDCKSEHAAAPATPEGGRERG